MPSGENDLATLLSRVRTTTEALGAPLSPEDCAVQSMEDASPVKWHLAHSSWFFETFLLEPHAPGYPVFAPGYRVLFNSYYNQVGDQYPRPARGMLTRPSLDEVLAYRAHVDRHMTRFLDDVASEPHGATIRLGLEHEQQHQELILTDVKHLLAQSPLHPVYRQRPEAPAGETKPLTWRYQPGGVEHIGHDGTGFCFDNEGPRHRVVLESFELASRPVTNGEFLAFMDDDAYTRPELWLSDGWAVVQGRGWSAPLYWEASDDGWHTQTLAGFRAVREDEPACHLSYYEADAYARWAAARLPTEAEWEVVAAGSALQGNFLESGLLHPAPATPEPWPAQLFGDVWEWTRSPYGSYPGYRPPEGALGEYNGKFMINQLVLRGGSCATPRSHSRATYRNFFFPHQRWQFSGLRLARDAE
jgi:ergothioneine biosynthesis protein EgtB